MLHQPSKDEDNVQPAEEMDDREVERYGEGGGEDQEEVEDFFSNMAGRQVTDGLVESKMPLVRLIKRFHPGEPAAPSSKLKAFGANGGAEGEDQDEQGGRLQEEEGKGAEGSRPEEEKRRGRGGARGNREGDVDWGKRFRVGTKERGGGFLLENCARVEFEEERVGRQSRIGRSRSKFFCRSTCETLAQSNRC